MARRYDDERGRNWSDRDSKCDRDRGDRDRDRGDRERSDRDRGDRDREWDRDRGREWEREWAGEKKGFGPQPDEEDRNYVHHVDIDLVRSRMHNSGYRPPKNPVLSVKPSDLLDRYITTDFQDMDMPGDLADALEKTGYKQPTPIQSISIPIALKGYDILTVAQTGSGKTLCFLIAMGNRITCSDIANGDMYGMHMCPSGLVITPTRELALQIIEHASTVYEYTKIRTVGAYGGVGQSKQITELETQCKTRKLNKGADLVVGCPGRLKDLKERGNLNLSMLHFLVLDEADRLLDMGFQNEMDAIVLDSEMPKKRQTMMYSATFDQRELDFAGGYLNDEYVTVQQGVDRTMPKELDICFDKFDQRNISSKLSDIVKDAEGQVLAFVATKSEAAWLSQEHKSCVLHGDMTQPARERNLEKFRENKSKLLIATDVAQRGIDIAGVTDVVSISLPNNEDDFLHRYTNRGLCIHVQGWANCEVREAWHIPPATRRPLNSSAAVDRKRCRGVEEEGAVMGVGLEREGTAQQGEEQVQVRWKVFKPRAKW
eukprot:TRINITY_DN4173_c0_g1_i3.p1 TRINITY_DN4173_c0_g1~~TRINITY_DN4173_c0_g1_i3.p1  ORF type:complete len:543 (+),score=153.65 TRINITY_DN4173_c0_g1_i3:37-1665(+)